MTMEQEYNAMRLTMIAFMPDFSPYVDNDAAMEILESIDSMSNEELFGMTRIKGSQFKSCFKRDCMVSRASEYVSATSVGTMFTYCITAMCRLKFKILGGTSTLTPEMSHAGFVDDMHAALRNCGLKDQEAWHRFEQVYRSYGGIV